MCHSLQGGLTWVSMHGQCKPWNKPTWKHVVFWWWLDDGFGWSETMHLETWTSKITTLETCQVLVSGWTCVSMPRQPKPPKHIPAKTCKVSGAMFQPHAPIFHVPPCDPHPCPMTHPWCFRFFSTSHCHHVFFLPNFDVFIIVPPP
jgi:hypothetical protein